MPGFLPRRKYVSTECVQRILPPLYAHEPSHCKGLRAFEYDEYNTYDIKYKNNIYIIEVGKSDVLIVLTRATIAAKGRPYKCGTNL